MADIKAIPGLSKTKLQELKDRILNHQPEQEKKSEDVTEVKADQEIEYFNVDAEKNWLSAEQGNVTSGSNGISVHKIHKHGV